MATNPTIVVGSLNDQEIKESINKLVEHVDKQSMKMAENFDAAIQLMKDSLKSLGKTKVDISGSIDGGSIKRTKAIQAETQANKELTQTIEQQAATMQRARGGKKDFSVVELSSDVEKGLTYYVNLNKDVDAQLNSILQKEQNLAQIKKEQEQYERAITEEQQKRTQGKSWRELGYEDVHGSQYLSNRNRNANVYVETQKAAYDSLGDSLRKTTKSYNEMTKAERESAQGKELVEKMQGIKRSMREIQQEMNRPTNLKSVMGLDEKTLDNISYKIQQLNAYKRGINLTDPAQKQELRQIDGEIVRLNKDLNKYMATSRQVTEINNALGRSWNYMKNRLAFYFTVGASTAFVKNLIEIRSQYEMNERALGILVNSAERGTQIFKELSEMSLVSPYTLIELSSAARQLTAYDIAAKDVVDTTRRLADMASAVGIPIERLTYALGQIKAYGYLNSRDNRMFANAGIPLVKQLADYYTELEGKMVSTADVYDRIKKKAVDYNTVMQVIYKMTDEGGKFFDFQAKMAETLKVRLANLTLAWNNMLNDIGKETQGLLTWGIGALRELFLHWKALDSAIKNLALAVGVRTLVVALRAATIGMGAFGKAMTWNAILGKRLGGIVVTLGSSLKALAMTPLTWWTLLAVAAASAANEILFADKATKEFNQSLRESAKNTFGDLDKFIQQYKSVIDDFNNNNGANIDKNEAKKVWEAIREQIELSLSSSDEYIGQLMRIENVSERIKQGFDVLDDARAVSAALKEIGDDGITVTHKWSAWWNLWMASDGLIENLRDYQESVDDVIKVYGSLDTAQNKAKESGSANVYELRKMNDQFNMFKGNLKETTDSIIQFIQLKGWSADVGKINQIFSQVTQKLISENQLNSKEAFSLQMEIEEARSRAAKNALIIRLNDETKAYKEATSEWERIGISARLQELREEYNAFDENNGRGRVLWEDYTKWMKEQHISEMRARFKDMSANEIAHLDFSKGEWYKWAKETAEKYAKEHRLAYNDTFTLLHNWVLKANKWSIFIPLTIGEDEKKSVYETLSEADSAIDTAWKKIQRLKTRQRELEEKGGYASSDIKVVEEYGRTLEEITAAQKDYDDALAKGGHAKKEDAKRRKEAKQAESELAKALKEELSTIDKVRSIYKDLTKEGMSHADAVERATRGWDETVNAINRVLKKNGLQKLDLSKFAGISNPRELAQMLQNQLEALVARGVKAGDIKELQAKINTILIDADKYDLTKITKGLNSELDKLKDEYELAVELDANPEMGDMFLNMFDIDPNALPQTIDQYAERVLNALNKSFEERKIDFRLPSFILTNDDIKAFKAQLDSGVLDQLTYDQIVKYYKDINGMREKEAKDILKQTQDLEYKLADVNGKIAIEQKKLDDLQIKHQKETNAEKKHLLELQIEDQKNAIDKLKESVLEMLPTYQRLFGEVAEHSAWMSRKLAQDYKNMLVKAKKAGPNNEGKFVITDPISGEKVELSANRLGKEIKNADKELRKTQSIIKKLREAFTKGEDKEIDWVHGIELVGEEAKKAAEGLQVISQMMQQLGASEDAIEVVNDLSASLEGVGTAAQGIGQIASGDYIGGAVNVIKGLWQTVSTWFDNSDKKITRNVKRSEDAVKRLELAYKQLEYEVEQAYGTTELGAQKAVIANKKLQLAELQRQLQLEKSRKAKNQDTDKIRDLEGQIVDMQHEINDGINDMTNNLLGISGVGDAVENMIGSIIDSLRNGEDALDVWNTSIDDMIANMIMKFASTKILGPMFEKAMQEITDEVSSRGAESYKMSQDYRQNANKLREERGKASPFFWKSYDEQIEAAERLADEYEARAKEESAFRLDDLRKYADLLNGLRGEGGSVVSEVEELLKLLGLPLGETNKNLSNLQQGISGLTEDQAGALEAYWNANTQQQYVQSELLTQIRDAVVVMNADVQVATIGQILLQLQSSYQVQMSIRDTLQGWSNPNGMAIRVEMV